MVLKYLPRLEVCCHCVTDLKTATAIITALAIVASPVLSWAVIRHSYVIRVSCYVTTNTNQPDVIDINLNNVLSFGFGANAGLGPSCLSKAQSQNSSGVSSLSTITFKTEGLTAEGNNSSSFITSVKYVGWIVLLADVTLVASSIFLLIYLFREGDPKLNNIMKWFLYSEIISVVMSFIYGMLYVVTCLISGGSFPIFEFVFAFIDLGMWVYFLVIVNSYRSKMFTHLILSRFDRTTSQANPQSSAS